MKEYELEFLKASHSEAVKNVRKWEGSRVLLKGNVAALTLSLKKLAYYEGKRDAYREMKNYLTRSCA